MTTTANLGATFTLVGTVEKYEQKTTQTGTPYMLVSISVPSRSGGKAWHTISLFDEQYKQFTVLHPAKYDVLKITGGIGYRKSTEVDDAGVRKDSFHLNLYAEQVEKADINPTFSDEGSIDAMPF